MESGSGPKPDDLSPAARLELAQRMLRERREKGATREVRPAIPRVPRDAALPASFAQERFWFFEELDPGKPTYHLAAVFTIRGALDVDALRRALLGMVERHESLRTTLRMSGGALEQVVHPSLPLDLEIAEPADPRAAEQAALELRTRPFDLVRGPLARAGLVRISADEHWLTFVAHHIITDGGSIGVLLGDLGAVYAAFREGKPSPLAPLPVQYADFAAWQRSALAGKVGEEHLAFWKSTLAGAPPALVLPGDRPRPPVKGSRGGTVQFTLPADASAGIAELARVEGASRFMVFLAAFDVLLARLSGEHDIVVGTAIANRGVTQLEGVFGCFANSVAIRTNLHGSPSFREVLQRTKKASFDALEHGRIPFERVVEMLQPKRDPSRTPVYQIMFAHRVDGAAFTLPGLDVAPRSAPDETDDGENQLAAVDLSLIIAERGDVMSASMQYDAEIFDRVTVERFAEQLRLLVRNAMAAPDRPVDALPLFTEAERARLIAEASSVLVSADERTLAAVFDEQAQKTPRATAITTDEETMTYGDVRAAADRVAARVRSAGVPAGSVVAVMVERSSERLVAMLGVLKAGCVHAGLDPELPAAHVAKIAERLAPGLVITRRADRRRVPGGLAVLEIEACARGESGSAPETTGASGASAVLYRPRVGGSIRGLLVTHRGITTAAGCVTRLLEATSSDVFLDGADASETSTLAVPFAAWSVGASVVVLPAEAHRDSRWIVETLKGRAVTVLSTTGSMLRRLAEEPALSGVSTLRAVCTYGEPAEPLVVKRFFASHPRARLLGLHGPADSLPVTHREHSRTADAEPKGRGDLGMPLPGTRLYVLDGRLEPVPLNVPGRLFVGGAAQTLGFVNDDALTAARLVPDVLSGDDGSLLFTTGTRVRRLLDESIDRFGEDAEVHIGAYVMELADVEEALRRDPRVTDAAVVVRHSAKGEPRLTVYAAPSSGGASLERVLQEVLPDLPSELVAVKDIPRNAGLVDRDALLALGRRVSAAEYVAPRTPVEAQLAELWQVALRVPRVGAHDDFFALGGHSLLATSLIARLRDALGVVVSVRAVFEAPTVAGLAEVIEQLLAERRQGDGAHDAMPAILRVSRDQTLPASFAQERFWFFEQLDPGQPTYHMSTGFTIRGPLDVDALRRAFVEMVDRHESLRTTLRMVAGALEQVVHPSLPLDLEVADAADARSAERAVHETRTRPFDLERGPLARVGLLRIAADEHLLTFVAHHIVTDGASMGVLLGDLAAVYAAFREGRPSPLPPLPIQYADFAAWQRTTLSGPLRDQHLAFWKTTLGGAPPALVLPYNRERPPTKTSRGGAVQFTLPPDVSGPISELARAEGATRFMVFLAAFNVLLARLAGEGDIVVGTAIANRAMTELEGVFGCFANTVAIRTKVDDAPSFRETVRRTKKAALTALEHGQIPFERVVEMLQPKRDPSRTPVYQIMFGHRVEGAAFALAGVDVSTRSPGAGDKGGNEENQQAAVDLTLMMAERGDVIAASLQYDAEIFDRVTVERFAEQLRLLVRNALDAPDQPIDALALMTDEERDRLIAKASAPLASAPDERTLPQVFDEQARKTPRAVAITSDEGTSTYQEVSDAANRVASHVLRGGAAPGSVVAVMVERSSERLVAMLGVLKAGCVYAGLDPELPAAHVAKIAERLAPGLVITRRADRRRVPGGLAVLEIEACARGESGSAPETTGASGASAVLYRPRVGGSIRGLLVTHRGITTAAGCVTRLLEATSSDVFLDGADASETSTLAVPFAAWSVGASVVVLPAEAHRDSRWIVETLKGRAVTVLSTTGSMLRRLAEEPALSGVSTLRAVCTYGEPAEPLVVKRFFASHPRARLLGLHGPADSLPVTHREHSRTADAEPKGRGDLGMPLPGTRLYVLDGRLEPVPLNVPGRLFVGGAAQTLGFVNDDALTAARLVPDVLSGDDGSLLFTTGTRVRRLLDESIDRFGEDAEVHVGAYVMELADVEDVLRRDARVTDAAVLVRHSAKGEPRLVVYAVPAAAGTPLDRLLQEALPDLPSELVPVKEIPRNEGGVIDRDALLAVDRKVSAAEYVAARTPVEEKLVELWQGALGVARVGINDDFFALGGHSLLATSLVSRLRDTLGLVLPVRAVFEAPTVAGLAAVLETHASTHESGEI